MNFSFLLKSGLGWATLCVHEESFEYKLDILKIHLLIHLLLPTNDIQSDLKVTFINGNKT